jgi:hypothetical protein
MMKQFLQAVLIGFTFLSCQQPENTTSVKDNPVSIDTPRTVLPPVSQFSGPDLSPADILYFPVEYPKLKAMYPESPQPVMRIIYSRPHKQGRIIFGELVKYNEPWRMGANEATELEIFSPVSVQNKSIRPGRYILYCIPQETKWTIVLNANLYSWGLKQHKEKDQYRMDIPVEKNNSPSEYFTMAFEKTAGGADLLIVWDDIKATVPFRFRWQ